MNKLLLIPLFCMIFGSVSFASYIGTYEFELPPPVPTITTVELLPDGNLLENTTYFYVISAWKDNTTYVYDKAHSGVSNEVNCTTNQTFRTCNITWNSVVNQSATTVFVTTTKSDGYAEDQNSRIGWWESDPSYARCYYPTLRDGNLNFYTHNDSEVKMCKGQTPVILPENLFLTTAPPYNDFPHGLNPRVYGFPILNFYGGTSASPITFEQIYNWSWDNNVTEFFYWDKQNFAMAGFMNIHGSNELHFKETKANWLQVGSASISNSNANSEFILGTTTYTLGTEGVKIELFGSASGYFTLNSPSIEWYDVYLTDAPDFFGVYDAVFSNIYLQVFNAKIFQDFKASFYGYFNIRKDIPIKNIQAYDVLSVSTTYNNMSLSENIVTTGRLDIASRPAYRIDKYISYRPNDHVYKRNVNKNFIDPYFPNSLTPKWYPEYAITGSALDAVYNSLILKVLDTNGNVIPANITITNKHGLAIEFNQSFIDNMSVGSDGYLFREYINIDAVTSTTIKDNSKNWTTDQWLGRNIMIISTGEQAKIESNTNNTLTLTFDLLDTPSVNDHVGIIAEMMTWNHTDANGYDEFNPITITIKNPAKATNVITFNISNSFLLNRDKQLLITLCDIQPTVYNTTRIVIKGG